MKTKVFFASMLIVLFSCSPSTIEDEVPTPTTSLKLGDKYLGGYIFEVLPGNHGSVVINTNTSDLWDSAKTKETISRKLPSCPEMTQMFKLQQDSGNILKIVSGVYWVNGGQISQKNAPIFDKGRSGSPCSETAKTNRINIVYVQKF